MEKYMNINYDLAKQLINYSNNISNLYNELYKLDIEDKKNSKEYTDYIGLIQYLKEKEDDTYYNIPSEHLKEYFDFFKDIDILTLEINAKVNKALFIDNQTYITNRILSILENEIINIEDIHGKEDQYQVKFINFDQSSGMSIRDFLENIMYGSNPNFTSNKENHEIEQFHDTAINMSIVFIEQLKQSVVDLDLKNDLTRSKYINSFSNPNIENHYLLKQFDLDLSVSNVSYYRSLNYILKQAYNNCVIQINELLNKDTYNNPKSFILNLSMLKSYLYFLSDNAIVSLINKIYSSKTTDEKVKTKIINEMKSILNIESR